MTWSANINSVGLILKVYIEVMAKHITFFGKQVEPKHYFPPSDKSLVWEKHPKLGKPL